ncbi:M48 family metallopeptidase [Desulfovibrio sp.]|uniref:M48 family metallopeptidase n=1 Tax=Desulfovibrio sp. TaxID=885 RepID=UPI0023C02D62|nr:M48 family metallopeptidase [Desulfovibrio sp.]MDE7242138.1 M48 family metallopeptidase [Desulfovibrio sp.]
MIAPAPKAEESVPFVLKSGEVLTATVRRSARSRRPRLSLSPRGGLSLGIPAAWPLSRVRALVPDFLPWLERAWPRFAASRPEAALPEKIVLPLAGRALTVVPAGAFAAGRAASAGASALVRVGAGSRRVLLLETGESLRLFGATDDVALCSQALGRWCRAVAGRLLPPHVAALARAHGFTPPAVAVRDQRSRWGSCSRGRGGTAAPHIQLNWRALLLPRPLLDHLCFHELCHLRHMDHSPAYRAELARLSPDWAAQERGLSRAWRELPFWALPADAPPRG